MEGTDRKNKRRQEHRNGTKAFWRETARLMEGEDIYSEANLTRMRHGQAPRRLALIRHKVTGETIEFHAPEELHHPFGYKPDVPYGDQFIVPVYPWRHSEIDEDRHFNWEFVQWVGFQ